MLVKGEEMLFALLRASLHGRPADEKFFTGASGSDWKVCYNTAVKQGVLALAWDGVVTLKQELHPPKQLKIQWAMSVDKYEAKHVHYCKTVEQLQKFYEENGIVAVQMKGIALAATYNNPSHREGGDIDIYTYSADTSKLSNEKANSLANELISLQGVEVDYSHSEKHSNFYYNGIPVENHQWFVNQEIRSKFVTKLNGILQKILNPKKEILLNGECKILAASQEFNMVFIAYHTFQHFGNGIALHHLYDWANLINKFGLVIPKEVDEIHFLRAVAALTFLSNRYLDTNVDISSFPDNYQELAKIMFDEMLLPKYQENIPYRNPIAVVLYKFRRLVYKSKLKGYVFGVSRFNFLLNTVFWHLRYPETIV